MDEIILTDSPPAPASQESGLTQHETGKDPGEVQEIAPSAPSLQLQCTHQDCSEIFSLKSDLLHHYLSQHPASPWTAEVVEILSEDKSDPADQMNLQSDTTTVRRPLENSLASDHSSPHHNPEVETHSGPEHSQHRQERERIQRLASQLQGGQPCIHGCGEKYSDRSSLHRHSRTCSKRPASAFPCSEKGCQKTFYYSGALENHAKKHRANIRNIEN